MNYRPVRKACLEFRSAVNRTSNIVPTGATRAIPLSLRNAKYRRGECYALLVGKGCTTPCSSIRQFANFNSRPGLKFLCSRVWSSTRKFRSVSFSRVSGGWQICMQMRLRASTFTFAYETWDVEFLQRSRRGSRFARLPRSSGPSRPSTAIRGSVTNLVGSIHG